MFYVAVDIGCIECGESSKVLGIFTSHEKASEVLSKAEKYQAEHWTGQHGFEIFEVKSLDTEVDD